MNSEWRKVTLGEISENVSYGYTESAQAEEVGPRFLRITDIRGGTVDWRNVPYCPISEKDFKKYKLKKGDIVVARTGNSTGENYHFDSDEQAVYASYLIKFSIKEEIDSKFVWYNMRSGKWWGFIEGNKTGSAQAGANAKLLSTYELRLPALKEQKRIAHILGTLDDKIELNRKMNETLEATAQALFKSWFVDFDPVIDNALATGNPIPEELQVGAKKRQTYLANHPQQGSASQKKYHHLFPSSFTFNETLNKWIPEGWEVTNLKECLDTISKTYNLKEREKIIFLNTGDIEEGKFLHSNYSDVKGLPGQAKKTIQKGDILYSEIRPQNKRFAFVYFDSSEYVVSTKLMVLRPKNEIDSLFYYQILKTESTIAELQHLAESRSGTFPQITFNTLSAIEFCLPNEKRIVQEYVKQLKGMFDRSIRSLEEVDSLEKVRDALLPKLISGKIRV